MESVRTCEVDDVAVIEDERGDPGGAAALPRPPVDVTAVDGPVDPGPWSPSSARWVSDDAGTSGAYWSPGDARWVRSPRGGDTATGFPVRRGEDPEGG